MAESKFTNSQIIEALKGVETRLLAAEICMKMGIIPSAIYKWRAKFGGMYATMIAPLKELGQEIKAKKLLPREKPEVQAVPFEINQVWSMEFIHDQPQQGRCFRLINQVDNHNNNLVVPGMQVDFLLHSELVICTKNRLLSCKSN